MRNPKLLLFDLMDTLLTYSDDGVPYWRRAAKEVAATGMMSAQEFEVRFSRARATQLVDGDREVTLQEILAQLMPGVDADSGFIQELVTICKEEYQRRTRPREGVEEMLRRWHGTVRMAVVSNFYIAGFPQELLAAHKLEHFFEFVIDSAQVGHRKPALEVFNAAMERGRVNPSQSANIWFIGDNWKADIEGARRAEMTPIYFSREKAPDPTVRTLSSWNEFRPSTA